MRSNRQLLLRTRGRLARAGGDFQQHSQVAFLGLGALEALHELAIGRDNDVRGDRGHAETPLGGQGMVDVESNLHVVFGQFLTKPGTGKDISFQALARFAPRGAKVDQDEAVGVGGLLKGNLQTLFPDQAILGLQGCGPGANCARDYQPDATR